MLQDQCSASKAVDGKDFASKVFEKMRGNSAEDNEKSLLFIWCEGRNQISHYQVWILGGVNSKVNSITLTVHSHLHTSTKSSVKI